MTFEQIQGNEDVKKALVGMVDSGRIPHAILFHEEDGGGAIAFCLAFLQYLNCHNRAAEDSCGACPSCNKISKLIHPDIHFVYPVTGGKIVASKDKPTSLSYAEQWRELVASNPYFRESDYMDALGITGKSAIIAVAEAKIILDKLAFNSLEGGYRAVVVYLPEKMNAETANRLLKSIEEPPEKTEFLLITHSPEKVLATISSRCQRIRIRPVPRAESKENEYIAKEKDLFRTLMDAILAKDLFAVLEAGESVAALPSRENMTDFCSFVSNGLRSVFLVQQGVPQLSDGTFDQDYINMLAGRLKRTFARGAMPLLDRAVMLIGRNVNEKIIFSDLAVKMFRIA